MESKTAVPVVGAVGRWLARARPGLRTVLSWVGVLALALLLLRRNASAGAAVADVTAPGLFEPSGAGLASRMLFGLLAVLALLGIGAALLRMQHRARPQGALSLVSRLPLTRGVQAMVVRVGDRNLLLGVTGSSVTLLDEIGNLEEIGITDASSSMARGLDAVARRLAGRR